MHRAASEGLARLLGPDHPDTLTSRSSLANAYLAAGRTAEAITMHEATLKLMESKLGPNHPDTLNSRNNLAMPTSTPAAPPRPSSCLSPPSSS